MMQTVRKTLEPSPMDVSQSELVSGKIPETARMQSWANEALGDAGDKTCALRIMSSVEMAQLNGQYADKHIPTNVLSFPFREALEDLPESLALTLESETDSLGDIAICAEVVAAEASAQGKTLDAHWAHMIVHGVLHLRGYDHVREEDAQAMEMEETRLMAALGFADPYETGSSESDPGQTERATRPL